MDQTKQQLSRNFLRYLPWKVVLFKCNLREVNKLETIVGQRLLPAEMCGSAPRTLACEQAHLVCYSREYLGGGYGEQQFASRPILLAGSFH